MKILALDQAIKTTGWAYYEDSNKISYGHITADQKEEIDESIFAMASSIFSLIYEKSPDVVIIEEITMQKNTKVFKELAKLQGCILFELLKKNIAFIKLSPTKWRKLIGIKQGSSVKRKDLKLQSIKKTEEELGIYGTTEDESDALCMLLSYIKCIK